MNFKELFPDKKPVIACIHLMPLPGAPLYDGNFESVINKAEEETQILMDHAVDGLIVENFRDNPFFPDQIPPETIAAMSVIVREIKIQFNGPVGVNALRNDAHSALGIAVASNADFIRVNVHTGATLTDQGIIQGKANETLRLRKNLNSTILIFADVAVKHARAIGEQNIEQETKDVVERGMADAVIVSGKGTGSGTDLSDLKKVKSCSEKPVIIGSGTTPQNLDQLYELADGFIVGSYIKKDGKANNYVDDKRVETFMQTFNTKR